MKSSKNQECLSEICIFFLAVHPLVMKCDGVFETISVGIFCSGENTDTDNLVDMKSLAV